MKEISSTINIQATPEEVWDVLMDFDAYKNWNPFIKSIEGKTAQGERLKVNIMPPGQSAMTFKPLVLKSESATEFRWRGSLGVKGLFDGEHYFQLAAVDGGTQLIHGERFSGLLTSLILKKVGAATEEGFKAMNEALKSEVIARQQN